MCGISAYFDKSGQLAPIGATLLGMLGALGRRGPDSAGLAGWGGGVGGLVVRGALAGGPGTAAPGPGVGRGARGAAPGRGGGARGPLLRFGSAKGGAGAA